MPKNMPTVYRKENELSVPTVYSGFKKTSGFLFKFWLKFLFKFWFFIQILALSKNRLFSGNHNKKSNLADLQYV